MNNYLITWFYAEKIDDESYYPSVGKNTSSPDFHEVYWKCVYDFFMSVILTQKTDNLNLLFFTNVQTLPKNINNINLETFFSTQNIKVVQLELTNKTPKDWYNAWRNQFFVFDILKYCQNLNGNILILDSDCLIRKSLMPIFNAIESNSIITYFCGHGSEEAINGISTSQMRKLYTDFFSEPSDSLVYCGGEFIGINSFIIPQMLEIYQELWDKNYMNYIKNEIKLNEEAHFLSLIYYRLGLSNSLANEYIRRIWTSIKYDNFTDEDKTLTIWHLPAEKKYGFKDLFNWFSYKKRTSNEFLTYLEQYFFINKNPFYRKSRKLFYKLKETFFT